MLRSFVGKTKSLFRGNFYKFNTSIYQRSYNTNPYDIFISSKYINTCNDIDNFKKLHPHMNQAFNNHIFKKYSYNLKEYIENKIDAYATYIEVKNICCNGTIYISEKYTPDIAVISSNNPENFGNCIVELSTISPEIFENTGPLHELHLLSINSVKDSINKEIDKIESLPNIQIYVHPKTFISLYPGIGDWTVVTSLSPSQLCNYGFNLIHDNSLELSFLSHH